MEKRESGEIRKIPSIIRVGKRGMQGEWGRKAVNELSQVLSIPPNGEKHPYILVRPVLPHVCHHDDQRHVC